MRIYQGFWGRIRPAFWPYINVIAVKKRILRNHQINLTPEKLRQKTYRCGACYLGLSAELDTKMKNEWDSKECFGQQAEDMLHGEPPYKCLDCDIFDKCHKITIAACLNAIATDLDLITQNGLATNRLMGFAQLNKLAEAEMEKEN
jgi:hypothetical protein